MKYHDIKKDDFLNGDGIRAVLFVSGCTHHCPDCQNPVTWNRDDGLIFDENAKKELFEYLKQPYVTGITFSGGDPLAMYNRAEVLDLIKEVKETFPDKTVWVYTGWTKEELQQQGFWDKLISNIDVIVEGKFVKDLKQTDYHWAGSTNQRILRKESDFKINTSAKSYLDTEKLLKEIKNELWWETEEEYIKQDIEDAVHALQYSLQGETYITDVFDWGRMTSLEIIGYIRENIEDSKDSLVILNNIANEYLDNIEVVYSNNLEEENER